jgi:hypothetical protein
VATGSHGASQTLDSDLSQQLADARTRRQVQPGNDVGSGDGRSAAAPGGQLPQAPNPLPAAGAGALEQQKGIPGDRTGIL